MQRTRSARFAGKLRLSALPLALLACLALFATPALGAKTHALKTTFGAFSNPSGIAIDESNGNVFVADGGTNTVEIFGPEGGLPGGGVTVKTIGGFAFNGEHSGLAIDNSPTSPSQGALYVADVKNEVVKKFVLEGGEYKLKGTLVGSPAIEEPLGVAVDDEGNVFVSDRRAPSAAGWIIEFGPTGSEIGRTGLPAETFAAMGALAFDSTENLLAQSQFGQGVYKFAADGAGEVVPGTTPTRIVKGDATGIAIDQDTDTLYVAAPKRVIQYSVACVPVEEQCTPELEFGGDALSKNTERIAVGPSGDIYVVDRGKGQVAVFDVALSTIPDATTELPTAVKQTSATLNGTVSAAGGPDATCVFQYVTKASFDATNSFEGASSVPCVPAGPFTGIAEEAVKADLGGLATETAYVFRLFATSANGSNGGAALPFATVGKPQINASFVAPLSISLNSATVEGLINPNGGPGASQETTYAVEYVSQADFEAGEYANATSLPVPLAAGGQAIGSGIEDVEVAQQLSGLSTLTTYHFRIVAENEAGETLGPDETFTTFAGAPTFSGCPNEGLRESLGSISLPDCRAYEQATPVDKNGAAPSGTASTVQSAPDGNGITYASGGGIPGAEGAQQYPIYLASRGADWSTQGLLPPASVGASAAVLGWGEDLSRAYVTQATLSGSPARFLERDSASRELRTIADDGGLEITSNAFVYIAAADNGSVVVFESNTPLFPGGAGGGAFNTYAWDRASGELRLAGALNGPGGAVAPAKGTFAGSNDAVSVTGHHHYNQAQHALSEDGSALFFTDAGTGQLYLRQNPARAQSALAAGKCTEPELACTVQVSASQRATPDPKGKKPATFWGATPDGSKAFFTSPGKLTDDATTGPDDEGNDLYRYDTETGELIDLAPDAGDPAGAEVQGVLGISDDGSRAYFAAKGKLGAAPSRGECSATGAKPEDRACNLYLWDDGAITFVAQLQLNSIASSDAANWLSASTGIDNTARVTPDGQTLLFRSLARLGPYDNQGTPEFYRYEIGDTQPACVSCSPTNAAPVGAPALRSIESLAIVPNSAAIQTRNLAAEGDRVFFETPDKLVAGDSNGDGGCEFVNKLNSGIGGSIAPRTCQDVYEWEAAGSGSCPVDQVDGCLYLLSDGTSLEPSYFADADAEGDNAFFFTAQPLVGQDKDQIVDIYDARVGGGIASQNPPPVIDCEGEGTCKPPPPPPPPVTPPPGSSSFVGPSDPRPCKKGQVRKHGKCVKKKGASQKKKHHKKTGTTRKSG